MQRTKGKNYAIISKPKIKLLTFFIIAKPLLYTQTHMSIYMCVFDIQK